MRVLVTGHRGYIGSVLVPELIKRGHEVIGCDTGLFEACEFHGEMIDVEDFKTDIRNITPSMVAGFEAVIHLAGLSNDPLGSYCSQLTNEINCEATILLANLAKKSGTKRFLFASSCSIYGASGENLLDEQSPSNPVTPYGRSKLDSEIALMKMADSIFSPTFIRAGTVYGVSPRIRFDLVANNLTAWACSTNKIFLKSDGNAWRPLIHVRDLAAMYVDLLESPRVEIHNQAFNAGGEKANHRIIQIAETVRKVIPDSEIVFANDAQPDKRNYRVSSEKINRLKSLQRPKWTLESGISELYTQLMRTPDATDGFEGSRYSRIEHVHHLIQTGILDTDLYQLGNST